MKISLSVFLFLLTAATMALADRMPTPPKIVVLDGNPSLMIKNPRIDPHDGKIRGTAYLAFGYAAPSHSHVHIYGLNSSGRVISEGCDKLDRQLLYPHPRLAGKGHDAFSASLGSLAALKTVEIVTHSGHDSCKKDDKCLFRLF